MKKIDNARDAFLLKIQCLYDIEKQLEKALPKLAKASTDPELKQGFIDHLKETKEHSVRLEQIFVLLDTTPKKQKCGGIRGIVTDGEWTLAVKSSDVVKDTLLAGLARYAEHYEMAGYQSAIMYAEFLGMESTVELLTQTLSEEERADVLLGEAMKQLLKKSQS